jgi:hypothetical protein
MEYNELLALFNPQTQNTVDSFFGGRGGGGFGGGGGGFGGGYSYNSALPFGSNPYANLNPNAYAGMDRRDGPGDRLLADLIRRQTQDYLANYAPIEEALYNSITATGTTAIGDDLERTRGAVMDASRNVQGMADRSADRFGVARNEMDPTATTSNLVGGINATYQRDSDRRLGLLTGGLSQVSANARTVGRNA